MSTTDNLNDEVLVIPEEVDEEELSHSEEEDEHAVPEDQQPINHHSNNTPISSPVLMNLAQAAIQRIGQVDSSIIDDDFQPVRKKRKTVPVIDIISSDTNNKEEEISDENEVIYLHM